MYTDNETTTLKPQDGNAWAVVSNMTQHSSQAASISAHLVERWTRYGAPALEAGDAISPFITGFELQAHFLAGNATAALALMRRQWGFMLDDARMTDSTFAEGYSVSGELHYAPYLNDARISHAHGWATGPTSSLTAYVAGIQLRGAGGSTWRVAPQLADLRFADAGFRTRLGFFAARTEVAGRGWRMVFQAPLGTSGEVGFPSVSCEGSVLVRELDGRCADVEIAVTEENHEAVGFVGLAGGRWEATFACHQE